MRNLYHYILGFTIAYLCFILGQINTDNFPLSLDYWNNFLTPLLGFFFSAIPAFFWERWQEKKFKATFDINDILRTGYGGILGGAIAMFFTSFIFGGVILAISIYLVLKHYKN